MCDGLSLQHCLCSHYHNPTFENFSLHLDPTISHIYMPKPLHHSFIHLPPKFYFLHFPRSTLRVMAQRRFEWQLFDLWFGQVGPGWNGGWFWCYFAICFHDTCRCCHCCEGQPLCKSICNVFAHDAVKDRRGWPRFQNWIEFWIEPAVSVLGRLYANNKNSNGLFWFWWDLATEWEVDAPVITWFDKRYFMWEHARIICVECCDRKALLVHVRRKCPMSLRPGWVWHEMWHTCGAWEGHASFDDRSM